MIYSDPLFWSLSVLKILQGPLFLLPSAKRDVIIELRCCRNYEAVQTVSVLKILQESWLLSVKSAVIELRESATIKLYKDVLIPIICSMFSLKK